MQNNDLYNTFLLNSISYLIESPELSYDEWMTIITAANGYLANDEYNFEQLMHSFANAIIYVDQSFILEEVNVELVSQKFTNFSNAEQLFVYEIARKFWLNEQTDSETYKSWLISNSAKITK